MVLMFIKLLITFNFLVNHTLIGCVLLTVGIIWVHVSLTTMTKSQWSFSTYTFCLTLNSGSQPCPKCWRKTLLHHNNKSSEGQSALQSLNIHDQHMSYNSFNLNTTVHTCIPWSHNPTLLNRLLEWSIRTICVMEQAYIHLSLCSMTVQYTAPIYNGTHISVFVRRHMAG